MPRIRIWLSLLLLAGVLASPWLSLSGAANPASTDRILGGLFVDRGDPQSALSVFLKAANEISARLEKLERDREAAGDRLYPAPTEQEIAEMAIFKAEALDSLDLSEIPEWTRDATGTEIALMLREILTIAKISPDTPVRQLNDKLWVVPGTYLQIGRLTSGLNAGDAVFTAETISSVDNLYDALIRKKPAGEFNAYRFYTETPGDLVVPSWGGLVMALPDFMRTPFGSNALWQWCLLVLLVVSAVLVPYYLRTLMPAGPRRTFWMAILAALIAKWASTYAIPVASITGAGGQTGALILQAIAYISLAVCAFLAGEWLSDRLTRLSQQRSGNLETSMIQLFCRLLSIAASLAVLFYGLTQVGVPIMGILAGLGVGGLAVALAAKPTIENLIAGVVLYLDQSLFVGDFIQAKDIAGTVEEIGMRSTRIRAEDGTLISITNSELSEMVVRNKSRRVRTGSEELPQT